jgi:hypothetical protein
MPAGIRSELIKLLREGALEGLVELSGKKRNVVRRLIALTYDRDDVMSWRAMEAVGRIAGALPPEEGRELIQRVLWMMREESGTNAWSAPYILGEILRENPEPYEDIVPVLASFHEEEFFAAGVLWALLRIAQRRPRLVEPHAGVAREHISSPDPAARGYAALLMGVLGMEFALEIFAGDETEIPLYRDGSLERKPLAELASEARHAAGKGGR